MDQASNDGIAAGNTRTPENDRDCLARSLPERPSDYLACRRLHAGLANAASNIGRNAHDRANCHQRQPTRSQINRRQNRTGNGAVAIT